MQKIGSFLKRSGELVETYKYEKFFSGSDFDDIINLIEKFNIKIRNIRISNSLEHQEHLFRLFDNVNDFRIYDKEGYYIEDFGVGCKYNDIKFDFTFDFNKEEVITFTDANINLDNVLIELENLAKKKVSGKRL